MDPVLNVKLLADDVTLPARKHSTDAGLDVYAHNFKKKYSKDGKEVELSDKKSVELEPLERVLVGSGFAATAGPGTELQLRPRSGSALKQGLSIVNSPATIDEQYRGEIGVILVNLSNVNITINIGDRIAQMIVAPVMLSEVEVVDDLPESSRAEGGFGSTGK